MIVARPRKRPSRLWWAVAPLGIYAIIVVAASVMEERLVFTPVTAAQSWQDPKDSQIDDVWLTSLTDESIHAWWLPPPEGVSPSEGVTLVCHGNAHNLSCREKLLHRLRDGTGGGVLIFDYPGFGHSGGFPTEASCTEAGEMAWQWLHKYLEVPAERILIYGESLGGGVAVELAARHGGRALFLTSTFASLPEAAEYYYPWLPCRPFMRNRFDNIAKLHRLHLPTVIVHGMADTVIPYTHAVNLAAASAGPTLFLSIPEGHHDTPLPIEMESQVKAFLAHHLPMK